MHIMIYKYANKYAYNIINIWLALKFPSRSTAINVLALDLFLIGRPTKAKSGR